MRPPRWLLRIHGSRYLPTALTFGLVVALAVLVHEVTRQWVLTQNQARFQIIAQDQLTILSRAIDTDMEVVHSLRGLLAAKPDLSREEFRKGVASSLARHPEIQALEWMIRVPARLRGRFEEDLHREGFVGFSTTELNAQGEAVVAPARPEYFVIHFVEPLNANFSALGYNVWGAAEPRKTLARALTGEPAVSGWFTLRQGETGFVVYLPLDARWQRLTAEDAPPLNEVQSLAVGVFRIKTLFESALRGSTTRVDFLVSDDGEDHGRPHRHYRFDSSTGLLSEPSPGDWSDAQEAEISWTTNLPLKGRNWVIHFFPSRDFVPPYSGALPSVVALAVLAIGGLMSLFGSSLRQTRLVETLLVQEADARKTAEAALSIREDFLAVASHELKTPITPLKIQLYLLRKVMNAQLPQPPSTAKLLELVAGAEKQVERLVRLIHDLLDVTGMTERKLPIRPETFDLALMLREVAEAFAQDFVRSGCAVQITAPQPVTGSWDRVRIKQLLIQLLLNAVKFGCGKPIELALRQEGDRAVLEVKDSGIGIAEADQQRIFGRFERAAAATSFGGLGLGLYIARQIVNAHDGEISVHSRLGEGTTFVVKLPLR